MCIRDRATTDRYRNAFLTGNSKGATAALLMLDKLNTRMDNLRTRMSQSLTLAPLESLPLGGENVPDAHMRVIESIQEVKLKIKSAPTNSKMLKDLEKQLEELRAEARALGIVLPASFTAGAKAAGTMPPIIQDIGRSIKENLTHFAANAITNIFSGSDREAIAAINEELRENKAILKDTSATKEAREAAKARIAILEEEMAAEKARGNVVVQMTALIIDSVKKIIKAKLAEAMAAGASAELKKGLPGLITAGVVIAGISALFNSKIPKLAKGGILRGETMFIGGEYPGANINPEVVAPLSDLTRHIEEAIGPVQPTMSSPIIIGGKLESKVASDGIYHMITLEHQRQVSNTGLNKMVTP